MRVRSYQCRMLLAAFVAGVLVMSMPSPLAGQASEPGTRVLGAEDLAEAGVYRLSDLFWLIDDWTSVSVNAYTWHAAPSTLSDPESSDWKLLIDGRPVNTASLNIRDINNIPLRIQDLERVEISSRPRLVAGRVARGGMIHLYTRRPDAPVTIGGSFAPGSEIGDPGPYEYTRFATDNVDRVGPNLGGTISSRLGTWYARAGIRDDERHASNFIRSRVQTLCSADCRIRGAPVVDLRSYHGEVGVESVLGHHRLSHYRTSLVDQLFFGPVGIEIPTNYRLVDTGLQWSAPLTETMRLNYDASHNVVTHAPLVTDAAFAWRQQRSDLRIELDRRGDVYEETFGLRGVHTQVEGYPFMEKVTLTTLHLYRSLGYQLTSHWHQYVAGNAYVVEEELGLDVLGTTSVSVAEGHGLSLRVDYALRPLAEKQNLWYWMAQGYDVYLDHSDIQRTEPTLAEDPAASTTFGADLSWQADFSRALQIQVQSGIRTISGLTTARYEFETQPDNDGLLPATTISDDARGTIISGALTSTVRLLPVLEQRIHGAFQHVSDANSAFKIAWFKHPTLRLGYTIRYRPVPRFSLFGRLRYIHTTDWYDYRHAANAEPELYTRRLPSSWQLHLTAQKQFWSERLRISLSLRNVLDKPITFHPAGTPVDMGFFLGAELRL